MPIAGDFRESPFCCLSNKADHYKNTGGGYRTVFWLIECVGLLENEDCGEGEWSGLLEISCCKEVGRLELLEVA